MWGKWSHKPKTSRRISKVECESCRWCGPPGDFEEHNCLPGLDVLMRGADVVTCDDCDEAVAEEFWNDHVLGAHQPRQTSAVKLRLYDQMARAHDYSMHRYGLDDRWTSDPLTQSFTVMEVALVMPSGFEVPTDIGGWRNLGEDDTVQFDSLELTVDDF